MKFSIGADPEGFFLKDNRPYSVIGLIGGTKEKPIPCRKGSLQEDNVLAEFNIDPAYSRKEFRENMTTVMGQLHAVANRNECSLEFKSHGIFTVDDLDNRKAMEFGCDPDFDAWRRVQNIAPEPEQVGLVRCAGGHIHVGWEGHSTEDQINMAKLMDVFLGVPSILLDRGEIRRQYYGKAGAFRPKEYGIEYRVLSNFWVQTDETINWVYNQVEQCFKQWDEMCQMLPYMKDVPKIINKGDVDSARDMVTDFKLELPVMNHS